MNDQSLQEKINTSVHERPWTHIAIVGLFHISIGFFFGHRYRSAKQG
jgi:hypothetical protein